MLALLAYAHVVVGLLLILFVLLQDPKGGAMGVFTGGSSSQSFFGSSGGSDFLTTGTKWLAVLFAASCLTLTYLSAKKGGSVMDAVPVGAPHAPAAPGASGASPGATAPAEKAAPAAAPATAPAESHQDKK